MPESSRSLNVLAPDDIAAIEDRLHRHADDCRVWAAGVCGCGWCLEDRDVCSCGTAQLRIGLLLAQSEPIES